MCDHGLHDVRSRPARAGDKLITRRFHRSAVSFFAVHEPSLAVCVPPGTEIAFESEIRCRRMLPLLSPIGLRTKLARVRLVRGGEPNRPHEALELPNGEIVLWSRLCEGQRATVLQLPVPVRPQSTEISSSPTRSSIAVTRRRL